MVHTQGGAHKRWSVATAGVLLFKGVRGLAPALSVASQAMGPMRRDPPQGSPPCQFNALGALREPFGVPPDAHAVPVQVPMHIPAPPKMTRSQRPPQDTDALSSPSEQSPRLICWRSRHFRQVPIVIEDPHPLMQALGLCSATGEQVGTNVFLREGVPGVSDGLPGTVPVFSSPQPIAWCESPADTVGHLPDNKAHKVMVFLEQGAVTSAGLWGCCYVGSVLGALHVATGTFYCVMGRLCTA